MNKESWFILIIALILLVAAIVYPVAYYTSQDEVKFTVKKTERVTYEENGKTESKYLVWSQEGEVFENTDTFMFMKFNSSDVYGNLENGKKVCARVVGWRNQFLSWYRNIIELVPCGG